MQIFFEAYLAVLMELVLKYKVIQSLGQLFDPDIIF